jgi:hypothetical protein
MALRPPGVRSIRGPRKGPTTRKGRKVQSNPRAVLPLAAVIETLTKTDPARATVTKASPAVEKRWTTASRRNGVAGGVPSDVAGPSRNGHPAIVLARTAHPERVATDRTSMTLSVRPRAAP